MGRVESQIIKNKSRDILQNTIDKEGRAFYISTIAFGVWHPAGGNSGQARRIAGGRQV